MYTKHELTQKVIENAASAFWKFLEILKMEEDEEEDAEEEDAEKMKKALSHIAFLTWESPFPPRHLNKKHRGVGIQVRDPSEWILIKFLNLIQERARSHCKKHANPRSRIIGNESQMIKSIK